MARRLSQPESRPVASNPELFGEDLGDLAWTAVGAATAAAINDKLVGPFAKNLIPGPLSGSNTAGKLVDAGTTAVSGYFAGVAVGVLDGSIGRKVRRGGVLLGVAKAISAFIPGFSLSAQFPALPGFSAPAPAPAKALPNGAGAASPVPARFTVGASASGL